MAESKKSTTTGKTAAKKKTSTASKKTTTKGSSSMKEYSSKDKLNLNPLKLSPISKKSKYILLGVIALILIGIILYINRGLFIAAMVNGQPVSRLAVVSELESQYGSSALDRKIDRMLIMQEAEAQGVTATQEEVENERQEVIDQVSSGNEDNFQEVLTAQGLTMEEFSSELELQIIVEKMLGEEVAVSDEEVDQFLESNPDLVGETENSEESRTQVREQLRQQKLQSQYTQWIESLRERANIQKFVNY